MERFRDPAYGGTDAILRAQSELPDSRFVLIDRVGLLKWARESTVTYWRAVLLHSFLDPDALGASTAAQHAYLNDELLDAHSRQQADPATLSDLDFLKLQLADNLRRLGEAVMDREVGPVFNDGPDESISLALFHAWSLKVRLPVITGWPRRPAAKRWPWGRHTTPRLEALAAAAAAHWRHVDEGGGYVPGDKTTASTNPQVTAWIRERYPSISEENALIMARILRDPDLDSGRPLGS